MSQAHKRVSHLRVLSSAKIVSGRDSSGVSVRFSELVQECAKLTAVRNEADGIGSAFVLKYVGFPSHM
jgi:hypothetical protein